MNNGNWYPNGNGYGYEQDPYWGSQQNVGRYPQRGQPMPTPQPVQPLTLYDVINQRTRVDWVQGEYAFRAYTAQPGTSVVLFDLDKPNRFYVKAVNAAGVPVFSAGFDMSEAKMGQTAASPDDERYVPREEYERSMNQIAQLFANLTEGKEKAHGQTTETARMGYESDRGAAPAAEPEHGEPGAGFPGV